MEEEAARAGLFTSGGGQEHTQELLVKLTATGYYWRCEFTYTLVCSTCLEVWPDCFCKQVVVFLSMVCYLSAVPDCDTVIHIYVAYTGDSLDAFKFSDSTNLSVVKLGTVLFFLHCLVFTRTGDRCPTCLGQV